MCVKNLSHKHCFHRFTYFVKLLKYIVIAQLKHNAYEKLENQKILVKLNGKLKLVSGTQSTSWNLNIAVTF